MTTQPRQRAGSAVGGRWASKQAPDVTNAMVCFNDAAVAAPNDWDRRAVRIWGLQTTFTRTVDSDGVTVTAGCDSPELVLLAYKGDAEYWSDNRTAGRKALWSKNNKDRRIWSADITRRMLEEGHVATGYDTGSDGVYTAMKAACSRQRETCDERHTFTSALAQIRGLALVQSMAPAKDWDTKFGGHRLPDRTNDLLKQQFGEVLTTYLSLRQPPWDDGVPWGPQPIAGHATSRLGRDVFVGENGDLMWRALTETDLNGMSPLKAGVIDLPNVPGQQAMVAAAALYDGTAQKQITSGLFDGVDRPRHRAILRTKMVNVFAGQLNPSGGHIARYWTPEQQDRIRGFIEVIEGLEL